MKGFFAGSEVVKKAPARMLPQCGACGLSSKCTTPKMPVRGEGRKGILIVGEFPSRGDDENGLQFSDSTGDWLSDKLQALGIDMERDCWLTNSIICTIAQVSGLDERVDHCRPNLVKTVRDLNPSVVLLLGRGAVQSMIGSFWKDEIGPLGRWVGWQIPSTKPNCWILPTWHPTYVRRENNPALALHFDRHLAALPVLAEKGRPWDVVPDYSANVEIILDAKEAARILREWIAEGGGTASVDYENTALKPEYPGAEILCASVCWNGGRTISFPWYGEVIEAMREFLWDKRIAKIAANLKHENRWTIFTFGHGVVNWLWDTMIGTHMLDNRPGGICSLKFQAYVNLGAEAYDDHINQFLRGKGEDGRINVARDEINLNELLLYCGVDSYLEFLLARKQMRQLKRDFPC